MQGLFLCLRIRVMAHHRSCLFRWLFWLGMGATLVLSLMVPSHIPSGWQFWDKAQHTMGFALLTWLACCGGMRLPHTMAGLVLWGTLIEVLQSMTTWRQGDVGDWLANTLGICAGLLWYRIWPLARKIRT